MPEAHLHVVDRIYDAFRRRDYSAVLATFDPGMEWVAAEHSPLADRSPYCGLSAIRAGVFERIGAGFERLEVRVDELIDAGDRVVVLGRYEGAPRSTGRAFQAQVAHVWTFTGGKPVRFQQYVDTYQLAESLKG